ncbi:FAD-binding oxidoreductase [Lacinutrix sp. 5H-3-7-4]|uniref:FAD-binding oxidoreductase n=1 Tax=Lacinutrix sp. (strain 5H-3-7-4) TaxID=983544 RepID=UPI00020A349E|nr:FAD-binding oxidoreductase [Lacinutrix sp. 5H-3-7-4]AEH02333.1 hypothetical protein Lacal_2491 [Lacinutrix sp. 5H-3-7-4]
MSIIENILKKVVLDHAVLTQKQQISPSVYKVRLQSENFKTITFKPGYFLRLGIGIGNDDISFKDKVRSYSVWNINQTEGFIDLAIV